MVKIISGHQANYLPYLGFFDKIRSSDVFFILDDAQFVKKGNFHHRNKIKNSSGKEEWLTIPIKKPENVDFPSINEVKILPVLDGQHKGFSHWCDYHYHLIEANYKNALYFDNFIPEVKRLYEEAKKLQQSESENGLSKNNMLFINFFIEKFGIKKPLIFTSEMNLKTKSSERILDICKKLSGEVYLSGDGARRVYDQGILVKGYLDEDLLKSAGISVIYQGYHHPVYPQINGPFLPYMCAFDYLFNCGNNLPPCENNENNLFGGENEPHI